VGEVDSFGSEVATKEVAGSDMGRYADIENAVVEAYIGSMEAGEGGEVADFDFDFEGAT
jgi:hypothetical protein